MVQFPQKINERNKTFGNGEMEPFFGNRGTRSTADIRAVGYHKQGNVHWQAFTGGGQLNRAAEPDQSIVSSQDACLATRRGASGCQRLLTGC